MKNLIQSCLMLKIQMVIALLSILLIHSCVQNAPKSESPGEEIAESYEYYEETEDDDESRRLPERIRDEGGGFSEEVVAGWNQPDSITSALPIELEEYKVVLDVTEIIKKHKKGEFKVWIGSEVFIKEQQENIARDTTSFPGILGQYAKITPYAPDFDIEPKKSECVKIHPSGSCVRFVITPKERGEFKVSAIVELFEGVECSGIPIPKSSETLTVLVKVDAKHELLVKLEELLSILWSKFTLFWASLCTLLFGVVYFLIKRRITKKTGFEDKLD